MRAYALTFSGASDGSVVLTSPWWTRIRITRELLELADPDRLTVEWENKEPAVAHFHVTNGSATYNLLPEPGAPGIYIGSLDEATGGTHTAEPTP